MNYRLAQIEEANAVCEVIQQTIKAIYPKYYPGEVVDFFMEHHNIEAIEADIQSGNMNVLIVDDKIVGTGCYVDDYITSVYVLPEYQGRGFGKFILNNIEAEIIKANKKAYLDSSLPAAPIYEKLGYRTIKHERNELDNGIFLTYEVMEKYLNNSDTDFNYNGKSFMPIVHGANGDVDDETIFVYYQNGNIVWAEYQGGNIEKGTLVGTVSKDGVMEFNYQHINSNEQVRVGKCRSTPRFLENGKIELVEEWQWLDGDFSSGKSVIMEM